VVQIREEGETHAGRVDVAVLARKGGAPFSRAEGKKKNRRGYSPGSKG
jgi:hypothetical protein